MPNDDSARRLASDFLAGLVDGDFERMRSALHSDAAWTVPGSTAISGTADGADAIIDRARSIFAADVEIDYQRTLYGMDDAALMLHNTGRRGEVELDEQVLVVLTLREGKIAAAQNLISDVPGLDAFFAASE